MKIASYIENGKRFDILLPEGTQGTLIPLPFSKGGPGSGRYPAGSGKEHKIGDSVIITGTSEYYDGREGKVEWVGDGKVTVVFDDGKSPKSNLFDASSVSSKGSVSDTPQSVLDATEEQRMEEKHKGDEKEPDFDAMKDDK